MSRQPSAVRRSSPSRLRSGRALRALALALALACAASPSAEAATVKLLLAVGSNVGDPDDAPLAFARDDAQRVARLFVELGAVSADRAVVVVDQGAPRVRERLAELAGRVAELAAAGHDVILVLYVSAHARDGVLHLAGTHLPIAELRDFAQGTRARLRVVVVDACESGPGATLKGGAPGPEYEVAVDRLPLEGQVFISSSGPSEPSQEWASLGGSLFTHHLLTGLRGDADAEGDGKVTLAEAYAYAYRRTVVDAARGAQHPSFDLDLKGSGELVLTEPRAARSALLFPAALEGHYVLASQPRPDVVAEVDKRAGRALRLAVPPGHYLLRKRLGRSVGLLELDLPWGGERVVDEAGMERRPYAEVAEKGGAVELTPSAALLLATVGSEPLASSGARWQAGAGFRRTFGQLWLAGELGAGAVAFRGAGLWVQETAATAAVSFGFRVLWTPLIPQLGLRVELASVWQAFRRDQEAEIARVLGLGPIAPRHAWGAAVGPTLGLEIPLPGRAFALASVQVLARALPAEGQPLWTVGASGQAALGWRF